MSARAIIRPATSGENDSIARQRLAAMLELAPDPEAKARLRAWLISEHEQHLAGCIEDGCVLTARMRDRIVGSVLLDLDAALIDTLCVLPDWRGLGLGRRLLQEAERLAVSFGMRHVTALVPTPAAGFFTSTRYHRQAGQAPTDRQGMGVETILMRRDLSRRQTRYGRRIGALQSQLGIPADYGRRHRLKLQPECKELATIGTDFAGREQFLRPDAALAWYELHNAAVADDIELQVVSAYRSVEYQAGIIRRKRERRQPMKAILEVSAAPGYSEHHTGRALDLNGDGCRPLQEEFENSRTFEWLLDHAGKHGFRLSYPRGNRHLIAYEPWHWAWVG